MSKYAISNTGPMISAFQSGQVELLKKFYDKIYIPFSELSEYEKHGAGDIIKELIDSEFIVVCELTESEKEIAKKISEEIADNSLSKNKNPQNHYSEAEAMVLMQRKNLGVVEILIDELAAREVAQKNEIPVIGFPGILVRACKRNIISAEDVKNLLIECQQQGTHYSNQLIEKIYNSLKGGMQYDK